MPWLGTISLDISGYDIVKKITGPNPSEFYKKKFSESPDYWQKASPFHALNNKIPPFLAICSRRSDDACSQAENFIRKAENLGSYAKLLPVGLSHGEINAELGKDSCYTNSQKAEPRHSVNANKSSHPDTEKLCRCLKPYAQVKDS
ncbi:hypothetical protein [Thalassomonas actiniarum]|nr:hypothetical protein [Thalassomonas actiniarum]